MRLTSLLRKVANRADSLRPGDMIRGFATGLDAMSPTSFKARVAELKRQETLVGVATKVAVQTIQGEVVDASS